MKLHDKPELIERLAAEFALGTLKGAARRRFEQQAREHRNLRLAVQRWQDRLSSLTVLQPGVMPDSAVWVRVRNLVQAELAQRRPALAAAPQGQGMAARAGRALAWWRGAAFAGAVASVLLLVLNLRLANTPTAPAQPGVAQTEQNAQYVAVLNDEHSAPAMLVTFDPASRALTLQRVGSFEEGKDKSLQLWALPQGQGPQSLGVLGRGAVIRLTAASDLRQVPALAVSLEPLGGSPNPKAPTGPVIFKGEMIRRVI